MQREESQIEEQEIELLQNRQILQERTAELESRLRTESTLHLLATQTLHKLETTNVYNDVFQIGHVPLGETNTPSGPHQASNQHQAPGPHRGGTGGGGAGIGNVPSGTSQTVGTINGLRLGGRPWVDWVEINAAFGLVALCIDRIADKIGYTFET